MRLSLRRKRLGGFLGVMALAAGLGACSGGSTGSGTSGTAGATSAPDPLASASAASASASASAVTERARVEAGYRAYWAALEKLTASGKPDPKVMADVTTPAGALEDTKLAAALFSSGSRQVGHTIITVHSITVTGQKAHVRACLDSRHWVSIPIASTTPTPGAANPGVTSAQADMVKTPAGRWILETRHNDRGFTC